MSYEVEFNTNGYITKIGEQLVETPITTDELRLLRDPTQLGTAFYTSAKAILTSDAWKTEKKTAKTLTISGIEYPYYGADAVLDKEDEKVGGMIAKEMVNGIIFVGKCSDGVLGKGKLLYY
jgi:hypothetical protein